MTNLPIEFEVPVFTLYGNTKGVAKRRKRGGFGVVSGHPRSLKIASFDRARTRSYWPFTVNVFLSAPFQRYSEILVEKCL